MERDKIGIFLAEKSAQLRTIQKELLLKMRDESFQNFSHFEDVMEVVFQEVIKTSVWLYLL